MRWVVLGPAVVLLAALAGVIAAVGPRDPDALAFMLGAPLLVLLLIGGAYPLAGLLALWAIGASWWMLHRFARNSCGLSERMAVFAVSGAMFAGLELMSFLAMSEICRRISC